MTPISSGPDGRTPRIVTASAGRAPLIARDFGSSDGFAIGAGGVAHPEQIRALSIVAIPESEGSGIAGGGREKLWTLPCGRAPNVLAPSRLWTASGLG